MFQPDNVPIIHNCSPDLIGATLYFVHDLHFGSELFDARKWQAYKK